MKSLFLSLALTIDLLGTLLPTLPRRTVRFVNKVTSRIRVKYSYAACPKTVVNRAIWYVVKTSWHFYFKSLLQSCDSLKPLPRLSTEVSREQRDLSCESKKTWEEEMPYTFDNGKGKYIYYYHWMETQTTRKIRRTWVDNTGCGKKTSPIWRGRCGSCGGDTAA
jgi:hypothetical protein